MTFYEFLSSEYPPDMTVDQLPRRFTGRKQERIHVVRIIVKDKRNNVIKTYCKRKDNKFHIVDILKNNESSQSNNQTQNNIIQPSTNIPQQNNISKQNNLDMQNGATQTQSDNVN